MSKNNVGNSIVRSRRPTLPSKIGASNDRSLISRLIRGSAWALATTLGSGIALISILSLVAYSAPDPSVLIPFLSVGALMPCMFAGGFVCAKKVKESAMLCGSVSGAVTVIVFLIISLLQRGIQPSGISGIGSLIIHASALIFSVLGSYAGNIKRRSHKRRFG